MKNLIYMCVFHNRKYIELLHLLLKSLKIFGKIDDNIDIVILTHKTFEDEIKDITKSLKINTQNVFLDLKSIPESKWARFKIFDINICLEDYSKVLYLDIDVIIQKDIHKVFDLELKNKLYTRKQGDTSGEYYGGDLFKEKGVIEKRPAFCSGVFLFKPCNEIQQLFSRTIQHIQEYHNSGKPFGGCIDQPFLNFHAISSNLHEIDLLSDIVTNSPDINTTNEVICHFAGNSCSYEIKIKRMNSYYNHLLNQNSKNFSFPKPDGWENLPMFKKIEIYGNYLTNKHAKYVDKIEAKKIVKEICGDKIEVAKIIKILESPKDLKNEDLNTSCLIKSAHASAWNINIDNKTSLENVIKKLNAWNKTYNTNNEKQYGFITPRFFIEEKIHDNILGKTGDALVYMIRCVHSEPISIGVKYKKVQNSYDIDWNPTQELKIPFLVPKPKKLKTMLEIAKKLSSDFEFVRIDLYIGKGDIIYFSEYTFTPAGGHQVYDMTTELKQGLLWRADKIN